MEVAKFSFESRFWAHLPRSKSILFQYNRGHCFLKKVFFSAFLCYWRNTLVFTCCSFRLCSGSPHSRFHFPIYLPPDRTLVQLLVKFCYHNLCFFHPVLISLIPTKAPSGFRIFLCRSFPRSVPLLNFTETSREFTSKRFIITFLQKLSKK